MSDYTVNTVNVQFLNDQFLDKLDRGLTKEAGAAMSAFVRQKLREEAFVRKIFTAQSVTAADLDRGLDDQPRVYIEKEPDSVAASISLNGSGEVRYFKGQRYEVPFYKIESATFKKSKYELATYRTDIRNILQENSIKDLHKVEDGDFWRGLRAIVAAESDQTEAAFADGFSPQNLMKLISRLVDFEQKPGKVVMHMGMYLKLLGVPATTIGSPAASEQFRGSPMDVFYGFELVPSIKRDVLTGSTYGAGSAIGVFAPEQYLGQMYSLQDPTVYLKAEKDMIEFTAYESIGIGIGNTKGFVLGEFNPDGTET